MFFELHAESCILVLQLALQLRTFVIFCGLLEPNLETGFESAAR
jgi:hypothetical protein